MTAMLSARTPFALVADELNLAERILDDALGEMNSPAITAHLKHYRGKRLRPGLLLLVARACGQVTPAHHTLAAVVEMIHTATLVHDDILDQAETRRYVRTVSAEWGNQQAVLLGDSLFTNAFFLSSTIDVQACRWIGEATNRVCAGEMKQVSERGNLHLSEADYYSIIDGKTAALVEVSTRIGAAYAGMNDEIQERFARYGKHLGIAFQIADDILDYAGDETVVGKTLGTDADQLKLTLPLIHCLSKLPDADRLREALMNRESSRHDVLRSAFKKTQSLAYAKFRAEEHAKLAITELDGLPINEAMTVLRQLPEWAIQRMN